MQSHGQIRRVERLFCVAHCWQSWIKNRPKTAILRGFRAFSEEKYFYCCVYSGGERGRNKSILIKLIYSQYRFIYLVCAAITRENTHKKPMF